MCGTRPEIIKLFPVIRELRRRQLWDVTVCHTGQHRDLADIHFREFALVPEVDLRVMYAGQTLPSMTASIIQRLEPVLRVLRPDVLVVQGDTTSGMAAALCAFGLQIPVVHLEAGLRTGKLDSPFPEEANRRIIAGVASLHLAPTELARANVLREIPGANAFVVGNTGLDALSMMAPACAAAPGDVAPATFEVLVTVHRREQLAERVVRVCTAIRELVDEFPELSFRLPLHPNPSVRLPAVELLRGLPRTVVDDPLSYREMVAALHSAWLVMTDSGGLQEEAAFLGRPALVLRDCTDRPEAVAEGVCAVVGTDPGGIVQGVRRLRRDPLWYASMRRRTNVFGDGNSRRRVVDLIEREVMGLDAGGDRGGAHASAPT